MHTQQSIRSARLLLRVTFGLLAIIVGIDTFTNILVNWSAYLAPQLAALPYADFLMKTGAVVQIIVGVLVLIPSTAKIGAMMITLWLAAVTVNVALIGVYDVALRDAVLTLAALTLIKLENALNSIPKLNPSSGTPHSGLSNYVVFLDGC